MKNKKVPVRQCIGCGEMKNKSEMMRVLKDSDGMVTLDVTGRKNCRGAYLCISGECLHKARKNRGMEGSFKMCFPEELDGYLVTEFRV